MSAEKSTSTSDAITLFQAYVDLINSERETIWARHNALFVANSLIVGALAISPAALWQNRWAALSLLGAGLLISAIWLLITAHGYGGRLCWAEFSAFAQPLWRGCRAAFGALDPWSRPDHGVRLYPDLFGARLYAPCRRLTGNRGARFGFLDRTRPPPLQAALISTHL
jgi:hypothetical protein